MSFWSKLGKIGLAAAPYVAAPFTGGASLMFTGAANSALQKWNQHDAQKAMEQGQAPSKFDQALGIGSGIGGMVSGATGGFGTKMGANQGGWQGQLSKMGGMVNGAGGGLMSGPDPNNPAIMHMQGQPSGQGTGNRNPNAAIGGNQDPNRLSGMRHGNQQGQGNYIQRGYQQGNQQQGNQGQGYQQGGQQQSGGGSGSVDPSKFRQYTGEDVGHEGTTRGGMNRQQYRDSWMGSGIGNNQAMDAWLAQNGGQRLNDSGVVRTPFGEILDMGIGYKGGRGQAGWTDIGMNNLAQDQGWGQQYNPAPQNQPAIGPTNEPQAPEPSYDDFVRDYWAPDRDAVLASKKPQQQAPNQTYAQRRIGRGGQYVDA